jgi:heat shock protein HslJ
MNMKRPAFVILIVLLLFGLVACDQLNPPAQEVAPTLEIPEGEVLVPETDSPTESAATEIPPTTAPTEEPTTEPAPEVSELVGTSWEWVTVIDITGQTIVTDPTRYTITFDEDNAATLKADCNDVLAMYFVDGSNIEIQTGATTLAACPPDSQDSLFLGSISDASTYSIEAGELFLGIGDGTGTMLFRPAGSAPAEEPTTEGEPDGEDALSLVGPTWQWLSTTTPTEIITAVDPTRYTIVFNEDGSAGIVADCNSVGATYTVSESSLAITLGPSTLMGCPPDSQANQFLAGLAASAIYFIEDGNLFIDLVADSGTMQFAPQATDTGEMGEGEAEEPDLTSATWEWFAVAGPATGITVEDPTRYTLTFNQDGSLAIKADCNMVLASYVTGEDGSITITLGPSTLAACPPNSQDVQFLGYLANARFYFIEMGNLSIEVAEDGTTLQFQAAGAGASPEEGEAEGALPPVAMPTDLVGTIWQWTDLVQPSSATAVPNPANYTIVFNADGTANIQADCNVGGAAYTAGEDGSLTITPGAFTLAYCGESSLDQAFIGGLTNAKSYQIADGKLSIEMLYESGRLVFSPGQ